MEYSFEILGVTPVLDFFNHQQSLSQTRKFIGVEYLGSYKCTLDALIESVETLSPERGWKVDRAVDTVINFWLTNLEGINHWKKRLEDAGRENLLVARLSDLRSLQAEFEFLFNQH